MFAVQHQIFLDENLDVSENYSKEAYCWYNMPIKQEKFDNVSEKTPGKKHHRTDLFSSFQGEGVADEVNKWANEVNMLAFEGIKGDEETDQETFAIRRPVAGDPQVIKNERAVVVSSVFLKIHWANNIFSTASTKLDARFDVEKQVRTCFCFNDKPVDFVVLAMCRSTFVLCNFFHFNRINCG